MWRRWMFRSRWFIEPLWSVEFTRFSQQRGGEIDPSRYDLANETVYIRGQITEFVVRQKLPNHNVPVAIEFRF